MTIRFLHGLNSISGIKPTYFEDHGHTVLSPLLAGDFDEAFLLLKPSSTAIVLMSMSDRVGVGSWRWNLGPRSHYD